MFEILGDYLFENDTYIIKDLITNEVECFKCNDEFIELLDRLGLIKNKKSPYDIDKHAFMYIPVDICKSVSKIIDILLECFNGVAKESAKNKLLGVDFDSFNCLHQMIKDKHMGLVCTNKVITFSVADYNVVLYIMEENGKYKINFWQFITERYNMDIIKTAIKTKNKYAYIVHDMSAIQTVDDIVSNMFTNNRTKEIFLQAKAVIPDKYGTLEIVMPDGSYYIMMQKTLNRVHEKINFDNKDYELWVELAEWIKKESKMRKI